MINHSGMIWSINQFDSMIRFDLLIRSDPHLMIRSIAAKLPRAKFAHMGYGYGRDFDSPRIGGMAWWTGWDDAGIRSWWCLVQMLARAWAGWTPVTLKIWILNSRQKFLTCFKTHFPCWHQKSVLTGHWKGCPSSPFARCPVAYSCHSRYPQRAWAWFVLGVRPSRVAGRRTFPAWRHPGSTRTIDWRRFDLADAPWRRPSDRPAGKLL